MTQFKVSRETGMLTQFNKDNVRIAELYQKANLCKEQGLEVLN